MILKKQTLNKVFGFLVSGEKIGFSKRFENKDNWTSFCICHINMGYQLHKHGHNFQWSEFLYCCIPLIHALICRSYSSTLYLAAKLL